jgi:hypothetical protein
MDDWRLRTGEAGLIKKWRDKIRRERPKGFEDRALAECAHELEELLGTISELPNEEAWVDALMKISGTDEHKRMAFKGMLRTYRMALYKKEVGDGIIPGPGFRAG